MQCRCITFVYIVITGNNWPIRCQTFTCALGRCLNLSLHFFISDEQPVQDTNFVDNDVAKQAPSDGDTDAAVDDGDGGQLRQASTTREYDDYEPLDSDYRLQDEFYDEYNHQPGYSGADYDQYFTQISLQDEVLERIKTTKPKRNSLQMNVLMFAMDSMSHMSYQRKLPKTYAYLRDELKAVILNGYNIVGDATTAAMLPILTGQSEMNCGYLFKADGSVHDS